MGLFLRPPLDVTAAKTFLIASLTPRVAKKFFFNGRAIKASPHSISPFLEAPASTDAENSKCL